ncbi:MAG: translation initiation factor IF-2 [Cyanosarcina radialis HA8281-LM2]|jgi:translation initiation factor IF-2|nr:translation initiation factor IF-2 [Cyanosarcina radialis HA8281-LM2]
MNNNKVRIYELSKELNLENKDILGICDQLNIAVKSHSSTISESEAERIRAAAEKSANRPAAGKRHSGNERSERRPGTPAPKTSGHPMVEHKQQILQIRHKDPNGSSLETRTQVAIPPQPVAKPAPASTMKPTTAHADRSEENRSLTATELSDPEAAVRQPRAELTAPPVKAVPPTSQSVMVERPILKRPKTESAGQPASPEDLATRPAKDRRSTPTQPEPTAPPEILLRPQRPSAEPASRSEGGDRVPELVGLMPKKKVVGTAEGEKTETSRPEEPKLIRPTPPRQSKRGKGWEEEEEESPEAQAKAKAATKGKRRTPLIVDDDEDLAEDLEDLETPVVVSLSVARPPKRKVAGAVAVIAPGAGVPKAKKAKSDQSLSRSERDRQQEQKTVKERPEKIALSGSLTVRELADLLAVPETEAIKILFFKGLAVNITQGLDIPTATMVAEELGVEVETPEAETAAATKITEMIEVGDIDKLQLRPPVVTIMGHVDHGKTTLLDAIRQTKVAQGEAGGITQHIGAYHVDVEHNGKNQQVVFLDTPGHEAFTAMRARGARVTDIAILVVAADDGVRPQTVEAIKHAQAAKVPIIVAVNKVDKPEAQPDRVEQELTQYGLLSEKWGGSTIIVPVSALKGENLDELLEMILLVAEIEELSANPNRPAKGTVIEAHLDRAKGPVATLLVQNGTLRVSDVLVVGHVLGKVRAMVDDRGERVEAATPSFAVEVLGLSDVPAAGDEFDVFPSEKEARALADQRSEEQRASRLQTMGGRRISLNTISAQAQEGSLKELNLILKADVQGSVEAILGSLQQLPQKEVQVRVLLAAAGEITETDVDLAAASGAVIIGFSTTLASGARLAGDRAGVDIREYNIIYKLLDDIQAAMEGLLDPEQVEEPLGQVEVRAVFPVGRGTVAGCYVLSGKAIRNCQLRVLRGGKVIYQGVLDSLKRVKDDIKEVNAGYECGIRVDNFNDWAEGDIIETFQMVSKKRTLSQ